ncbi:MAG: DUF1127 domain-containing protein [Geminicoccaceae bacterium]
MSLLRELNRRLMQVRRIQTTARALDKLSDRALSDLGIQRANIGTVARNVVLRPGTDPLDLSAAR